MEIALLLFEEHVAKICKSAFYPHIRRIPEIRKYLSEESTCLLAHALVTCRLDNGNAILYGLPTYLIRRLQAIQNCAPRLITQNSKFKQTKSILKKLHWLLVEQRLTFKI